MGGAYEVMNFPPHTVNDNSGDMFRKILHTLRRFAQVRVTTIAQTHSQRSAHIHTITDRGILIIHIDHPRQI